MFFAIQAAEDWANQFVAVVDAAVTDDLPAVGNVVAVASGFGVESGPAESSGEEPTAEHPAEHPASQAASTMEARGTIAMARQAHPYPDPGVGPVRGGAFYMYMGLPNQRIANQLSSLGTSVPANSAALTMPAQQR